MYPISIYLWRLKVICLISESTGFDYFFEDYDYSLNKYAIYKLSNRINSERKNIVLWLVSESCYLSHKRSRLLIYSRLAKYEVMTVHVLHSKVTVTQIWGWFFTTLPYWCLKTSCTQPFWQLFDVSRLVTVLDIQAQKH